MNPFPARSQRPRRSVATPSARVIYDAINQTITDMAMTLDRLTPETLDAVGADDNAAVRSLLEYRIEPRVLPCRRRRHGRWGDA